MKLRMIAFLTMAGLVMPVMAENTKLTKEQIGEFKASIYQGCIKGGLQRGATEAKAKKLCGCVRDVLDKNLDDKGFNDMYNQAMQGKSAREVYEANGLLEKLKACGKS